jgi:hypothetical protein
MRGLLKVEIIKDGIVTAAVPALLVAMNPNRASLYLCLVSACVSRTNGQYDSQHGNNAHRADSSFLLLLLSVLLRHMVSTFAIQ